MRDGDKKMTLAEILEQAKMLSLVERRELAKVLIDTLDPEINNAEPLFKTGAEIVALLNGMEAIEFVDSTIDNPVEWVKAQRKKRADELQIYQAGEE